MPAGSDLACSALLDTWLDAAPFRAHARHLMAASGLSSAELAELTGVSLGAVRHLVYGRSGRPARRICPQTARRLFLVTALEASLVRTRLVPSGRTRALLEQLVAAGWSVQQLSAATGLRRASVEALLEGREPSCPQLVALRVAATVTAAVLPELPPSEPLFSAAA